MDDNFGVTNWAHSAKLRAFLTTAPPEAAESFIRLVDAYNLDQGGTFEFDPIRMAAACNAIRSPREAPISAKVFEDSKAHLRQAFQELPDGRWTLSPELFSANNPDLERDG